MLFAAQECENLTELPDAAASLRSLTVTGEFGDGAATAAALSQLTALTYLSLASEPDNEHLWRDMPTLTTFDEQLIDRLEAKLFVLPLNGFASAARPASIR